ncbi:DUF1540 domain-containing protein [uncultured Friedmanniella sp.]|uniref:DUF1540 domain-containing protein n=1 Tax=uncultured Friedmanniella sp. TaxID=335381 RepID=UPI0035C99525
MTSMLEMPQVSDCTATACAYNHDGCHAFAVNIDSAAACGTFLSLNEKGGLDVVAQVGACQRQDCVHNASLECHAPSISVGFTAANADCLSYQAG